jgi:hypothetical protein
MGSVAVFGGAGLVGSTVVRELAHFPDVTRIHLFDINARAMEIEATDAAMVAEKLRPESLQVGWQVVDMNDPSRIAEALSEVNPDVVIQAATPRNWYSFPSRFEPSVWRRLNHEGKMGPWLPLFLVLPANLMAGRQLAGATMPVVQISYPDAVNSVLAAVGLAPTCGCGNSENIATIMRLVAADQLRVPVKDVRVQLVANHFHAWALAADDPQMLERPMWFRIYVSSDDVTKTVDKEAYWTHVRRIYPRQRPMFAATSAVQNAIRLMRDDQTLSHVTAPVGFPGGVDTRLGAGGPVIVLPDELPEAEARALLARAQQGDGIDGIGADGSVTIVPQCAAVMREITGYDCDVLRFGEVAERAEELIARLPEA